MEVVQQAPWRFVIPQHGAMHVPGVIYATRALLPAAAGGQALDQVANVATLPGIVEASYAMPDIHWGPDSRSAGWRPPISPPAV
jgi:tRNA-splicing ligase RtcB